MTWVAVGAAAIGAGASIYAGNKASGAAKGASNANIAEQQRQFDQLQANQQPYMQFGQSQLGGLNSLMSGDYSGFQNSPDYQYARQQMIYGQDHSAAAHGRLNSGGYALDLAQGLNGLASQNLGNYRGALQWGANLGQNAAAGVGQAGQNMANQNSLSRNNTANAQGTAYGAQASGISSLAGAFAGAYRPGSSSYAAPTNSWVDQATQVGG